MPAPSRCSTPSSSCGARNTDFNNLDLPANPGFECYTPAGLAVACGGPAACFTLRRGVTPLGGGLLADALAADLDVLVTWEGGQRFQLSDVLSRY